uniref:RGS domain-containing protein n=1 Tax=Globodera pallida TaxID=36090 RepID=A0A183BX06_GLOPA
MAKAEGIRGILFLQLCVTGDSVLKVQVRNGAYFLKSFPISSFVKALLAHKYGCLLFREFLQSEFSEENLVFWLECEEFKRMKTETSAEQRQIDHQQQWHIMPIIQVAMELFGLNNNSSPSTGCCLPTDRPSSASASDHAQQLQFGGEKQRREQQQMTDNTTEHGHGEDHQDFVSYLARLRQFLADSAT